MTAQITVLGIVQGVGYRPFVARLAQQLNITGTVKNSGGIVEIAAAGEEQAIDDFVHRLKSCPPEGASVQQVITTPLPEQRFSGFVIVPSSPMSGETPLIPPDLPMCETCRRELYEKDDRRAQYPFISCVACGPRYSIIEVLPYDRENITMRQFEMCDACAQEYRQMGNRRCHAQTIACHDCGPQLILQLPEGAHHRDEALAKAITLLMEGKVLAVKGIGGYQFACLPSHTEAVERLRLLKHREKKPFAVMFPSIGMLQDDCEVTAREEALLLSSARPIVLLKPKVNGFCKSVGGESRFIGAFLAYTPLHQLLTDACGPLVMTSGNLTAEPIITHDEEMLSLRSPYLTGVLYNLRRIVTPLDDSVARVVCGREQLIRRSRGYVPLPIILTQQAKQPVLAMGGDLKAGFCLYQNNRAYLSQYFGDMESFAVSRAYEAGLTHMRGLFGIHPQLIAHDLHPGYLTTQLAKRLTSSGSIKAVAIQHHHAHAASVMAEHGLSSCIGVVFDGTGYGTDGAVWGGEFLLCKGTAYERKAHLRYVSLCGGDRVAKNAALAAQCYLYAAGEPCMDETFSTVKAALINGVNVSSSSSMGRLFDAVSAMLELKVENSFEGECAIALENCAAACEEAGILPFTLHCAITYDEMGITIDQAGLFQAVYKAYRGGADKRALALGFHRSIAEMVLKICIYLRSESGENTVALSGGVFANLLLVSDCVQCLEKAGFEVYLNSAVPTNDGGICLGQAWLCAESESVQTSNMLF